MVSRAELLHGARAVEVVGRQGVEARAAGALHEVGVPFELKYIPLYQNANRASDYLTVNPEGKVPTLMIDGRRQTVRETLETIKKRVAP